MTSPPAEPDEVPQVVPSGDPTHDRPDMTPEAPQVPQGPQETNPDADVSLDPEQDDAAPGQMPSHDTEIGA